MVESCARRVTSISIPPLWLIVPAKTVSPTCLDTGIDSPVSDDSSQLASPVQHLAVDGDAFAWAHEQCDRPRPGLRWAARWRHFRRVGSAPGLGEASSGTGWRRVFGPWRSPAARWTVRTKTEQHRPFEREPHHGRAQGRQDHQQVDFDRRALRSAAMLPFRPKAPPAI